MSNEFDVRKTNSKIESIRFCDVTDYYNLATRLTPEDGGIRIEEDDNIDNVYVFINSREQAENLIKALQKAIEQRWV